MWIFKFFKRCFVFVKKIILHAIDVWIIFKINAMGNYHDLYLKTDVLLLADVFENFISTCLEYYKLDPWRYFSSQVLTWDVILKIPEIEWELVSDTDMYLFVEKAMRGGISYISKRFSKAYNKYTRSYDNSKPSKYITYLDANYLYGWAMSHYLSYRKFKWLNQK